MNKTIAVKFLDIMLILLLFTGFIYCYYSVFLSLAKQFRSNEIYSHGFLIPFISIYLFSLKRESIAAVRLGPNYIAGIPALGASLLCLLVGRVAGILVLEEISVVLSIASILLLLFGGFLIRTTWFSLFYLLFMIPVWDVFTHDLQLPFQLLSASIGVNILNWIGIPIYHNGIYIELPNITLEVAKSCSGLNYLISILAIGIPLSYIYTRQNWKRILILCASVVVAFISNGIRVSLVGLYVYKGIIRENGDIHGPHHMLQALSVSIVGYFVILMLVWILREEVPIFRRVGNISDSIRKRLLENVRTVPLAVCTLILIACGGFLTYPLSISSPPNKEFGSIPYEVGKWEGRDTKADFPFRKKKSADKELSRVYRSESSPPVKLYIGYYEDQNQGKELIDYENDYMFNGTDSIELTIEPGKTIRINKYMTSKHNSKKIYFYWAQVNGLLLLNKYSEKFHTVKNALLNRRTNGAIVIFSMEVPDENGTETALEAGAEFIREIYPILKEHLP